MGGFRTVESKILQFCNVLWKEVGFSSERGYTGQTSLLLLLKHLDGADHERTQVTAFAKRLLKNYKPCPGKPPSSKSILLGVSISGCLVAFQTHP